MNLLPKTVYDAYKLVCDLEIVTHSIITKKGIDEFVDFINSSIPSKYTPDYTIYLFNRKKYKVNRWKFLKDINKSPYQGMILWTSYKDILEFFDLTGKIFLKWNKEISLYEGDMYAPNKNNKKDTSTDVRGNKNNYPESNDSSNNDLGQYGVVTKTNKSNLKKFHSNKSNNVKINFNASEDEEDDEYEEEYKVEVPVEDEQPTDVQIEVSVEDEQTTDVQTNISVEDEQTTDVQTNISVEDEQTTYVQTNISVEDEQTTDVQTEKKQEAINSFPSDQELIDEQEELLLLRQARLKQLEESNDQ